MHGWEYAWVASDLITFSNPRRQQLRITDFNQAMHELGRLGFELVSAYGVSSVTRIRAGLTTSIGLGVGTTGQQKVESSTEHFLWFKRPIEIGG